ncbi:sulfotransferase family 2 domain-containing protein [Halochromatium roseum]|uniref:sulfotransferase family 2 domain-containing protein n=1 Tax=Halochromatium roseum TaxID=391920 RepID=UPI001913D700
MKFVPGVFLVYLSVPKVASSSISHALLRRCPTAPDDVTEHSIIGKCLTHWRPASAPRPDLPVFTYVRHPIEKFISFYRDKFIKARSRGFELDALRQLGFTPEMGIDEVVSHMLTIPVRKMEHHAQPQHRILAPKRQYLANFTGQVEEIKNTWQYVKKVSLTDFDITTARNSTAAAPDTSLSEESLAALVDYYADDFFLFGYTPSIAPTATNLKRSDNRDKLSHRDRQALRSAMLSNNEAFFDLAQRLDEEQFHDDYKQRVVKASNDFLVFANWRTSRASIRSAFG